MAFTTTESGKLETKINAGIIMCSQTVKQQNWTRLF